MSAIKTIIDRRKALIFLFFILIIIGFKTYNNIAREEYPDVRIPLVFVTIHYEGISPEDGENLLLKPVEKELKSIEGLKKTSSYAIEGIASIILEFEAGFDNNLAMDNVREKLDFARANLPQDIDEPILKEVIFSEFPILNLTLKGNINQRLLANIARKLRDTIEELPNILNVNIAGDLEETVEIIIDPIKLESYQLSTDIIQKLINNNQLVTAGALISSSSRYAIKIPGLLENFSDIANIPVVSNADRVVKLSDIAQIRRGNKPLESIARLNGENAITLEISKRSGKNVIETVAMVKKLVDSKSSFFTDEIEIIYSQDSSMRIITSNEDLQNNIILAIILVLVILLITVGLKPAFLVALSIPGVFVISILILDQLGFTLNIVVLFSLILSVGLIVDSAIVITEYADRKMKLGHSSKNAYIAAVNRMKIPIIISTITTLIVFLPLLFWPGVVGQFMFFIPSTLIITLSSSLIVALIFVPVIGSYFGRDRDADIKSVVGKKLISKYEILVTKVLDKPIRFTFIIFIFLIISIFSFAKFGKGVEFFPKIEPDNATINIRARGNLSIYEKDNIIKDLERLMLENRAGINILYSRTGKGNSSRKGNNAPADTIATMQLEFTNWRYRESANEILAKIKNILEEKYYGLVIETMAEKKGPSSGKDIQIELYATDSIMLEKQAKELTNFLRKNNNFIDIDDSTQIPSIEWKFDIDRELAEQSGLSIQEVGSYIKLVTNGLPATSYRPDDSDEEIDIIVRFPEEYRNLSQFETLKAILTNGDAVPISNFITKSPRQEIQKVDRSDGKKVVYIKTNMAKKLLANDGVKLIDNWIKENLSKQVSYKFRGEDEDSKETGAFLQKAFGLALVAMALILIIQFNSIYKMIIIISAAYLSTVGVLTGLLLTDSAFGIVMCGVGIISLAGIVVNNNIIFIDSFVKLQNNGYKTKEAIINSAKSRFRPILLTSITTILGLIPMIFSMNINFFTRDIYFNSPSSQWWQQLSTTIAGGLAFATILTLFLTPALLMIGANTNDYFLNLKKKFLQR
ncbi:MAG: efflux RND transporter permease subunit [Alphaproteobacteria bacterium]|jgi:multidrug efflux pump|nr:efflux RND transporter permease subunit [Alphaproteobacteria bacterium]